MTANGAKIDLSGRRTTYTKDATTVTLNPVLTEAQAAAYTIENVVGGTDAWQPKRYTDQAAAPVITGDGNTISWDDNSYILCWAIFKNNEFVQFVTTNSYTIPSTVESGSYTVRAANEMGGLSEVSNAYGFNLSGFFTPQSDATLLRESYYTLDGRELRNLKGYRGTVIVRSVYSDGTTVTNKIMKTNN